MSNRLTDGPPVIKQPVDVRSIELYTAMSTERVKRLRKGLAHYEIDDRKASRLSAGECKTCYYLRGGVIAGQAFSQHECRRLGCDELSKSSNTDVPDFCSLCSATFGICRRCGGDIEQKERRSLKPPKRPK